MKKRLFARLAAFSAAAIGGSAFAALPSGLSAGLTSIQTDGLALADMVWPVVLSIVGSLIVFKLFKRFIGKI